MTEHSSWVAAVEAGVIHEPLPLEYEDAPDDLDEAEPLYREYDDYDGPDEDYPSDEEADHAQNLWERRFWGD